MQYAQDTFISSTFWTERIGPTAALKTLELMERYKSWETISKNGLYLRDKVQELANYHEIVISNNGLPSLNTYIFKNSHQKYKTLITQEMLKYGYLANTTTYLSICHTKEIIDNYILCLKKVFELIQKCENGFPIDNLINKNLCQNGFLRLN